MPPTTGVTGTDAPHGSLGRRLGHPASPRASRGAALAGIALLLAAFLAWDSGTGLTRELERLPTNRFFERHESRLFAADDAGRTLAKVIALYTGMAPWTRGPLESRRLAWLLLLDRKRTPESARTVEADQGAAIMPLLVASLEREPVYPLTWAYAAESALTAMPPDPRQAYRDMLQSYRVAPVEPDFLPYRFRLMLRCWQQWDSQAVGLLRRDVVSLFPESGWHANTRAFVRDVRSNPRLQAFVTQLLSQDPQAAQRFQEALKKLR